MRRVAIAIGVAAVGWLVVLVILDFALAGRERRLVAERLGASLQASATVAAVDVALVRGRLDLAGLAIRRDDAAGKLALDVADIRCELPPLGLALADRECRELAVRGTRLEASSAALFRIHHPKHKPIRARRVVIDDATLAFAPSAFAPSLGRVAIEIDHAAAGATEFRTPLSFLFALVELDARVELPAHLTVRLRYRAGVLSVAGALFGSTPVELPVELPIAAAARDAREEVALLVAFAKDVAARLVTARAEDWLRARLGG